MTMNIVLFITGITLFMLVCMIWGFKKFPQEKWQIFAAIPLIKEETGNWKGLNLTYYGIISATAYAFSMMIIVILLGSCHIPVLFQMRYVIPVLTVAIPAARIMAWIVEKKTSTFTVGGATFTAIMILPWVTVGINSFSDFQIPLFCFFAAISIAYTYGEGLGRLACISFGCCYGKTLSQSGRLMNSLFSKFHFVFYGKTKKIAYASNLDGEPMIPIQAITSSLYTATGIAGTALFLFGYFKSALLVTIIITQSWRVISEFFRADYRGDSKFSAYQVMALTAIAYMVIISILIPQDNPTIITTDKSAHYSAMSNDTLYSTITPIKNKTNQRHNVELLLVPDIAQGLRQLWSPSVIIFLEFFWLFTFLYTGRSFVTGSNISFHVIKEKI